MRLKPQTRKDSAKIGFYNQWDFNALRLESGELACYTFTGIQREKEWQVSIRGLVKGQLIVYENDGVIQKIQFSKSSDYQVFVLPSLKQDATFLRLKIEVLSGEAAVDWVQLKDVMRKGNRTCSI